jgi:hypothetical protein
MKLFGAIKSISLFIIYKIGLKKEVKEIVKFKELDNKIASQVKPNGKKKFYLLR